RKEVYFMLKTPSLLARKQLLVKIEVRAAYFGKQPSPIRSGEGWIRSMRKVLGMTTTQLARRMGTSQPRICEIEKGEVHEQISLKTLKAAAQAMGCRLEYVFVPEKPIEKQLEERAYDIAKEQVAYISHHMSLENQALSAQKQEEQIKLLAAELLKTP